jgi:hypothetical protein
MQAKRMNFVSGASNGTIKQLHIWCLHTPRFGQQLPGDMYQIKARFARQWAGVAELPKAQGC